MNPIEVLYTNANALLFRGEGLLKVVSVGADGGNSGAIIYDGVDARGKVLFHIFALTGTGQNPPLGEGIRVNTGIYVAVDDANARVSIGFTHNGV